MIYWNYGNSSFFNTVKGSETVEKTYQFLDIEINKPIYRKLSAVQYDNSARYILVSVYSNFKPYDLTYATVKIYGVKKDKSVFFNNAKILDATNGKFEIDLTEQCLAAEGDVEIQIIILGANKERLSSNSFILNVKKNIIDPVKVTSENQWGILTEGLASLAEYDVYKNNVDKHDNEIKNHSSKISILSDAEFIVNSNGIDDTEQLQNALDNYSRILLNDSYKISDTLYIHSNTILKGQGSITVLNKTVTDILSVRDSLSENIKILGLTLSNANRFGIQIYGENYDIKPKDILIENVKTLNCKEGGVFLNSCHDVKVKQCYNDGGIRHVGTKAPITKPDDCYNIEIDSCESKNTTAFAYQTYYGNRLNITNCKADGSKMTSGDKTCITIDRSRNVIVSGNIVSNAPNNNIFITGSDGVTVSNNISSDSQCGIQAIYNLEALEDATINENLNITISSNIVTRTKIGIILNSCNNANIVANTISQSLESIYIMQEVRSHDNKQMYTENITIASNICDGVISRKPTKGDLTLIGNICKNYNGLSPRDKVISLGLNRFAHEPIEYVGLIKKENQPFDSWILENRYLDESFHKGWKLINNYGILELIDSDNNRAFGIDVSNGNNKKDFVFYKNGAGPVLHSPDGKIVKKIQLSNSGEIVLVTP